MNPAAMPVGMAYWASQRISPAPDLRDPAPDGLSQSRNEGEVISPPVVQESPMSRRNGAGGLVNAQHGEASQ
jgi:hypothetical protein